MRARQFDVPHLICEGACNPQLHLVDVLSTRDMMHQTKLTLKTIDKQRTLQYTPHMFERMDVYSCTMCGHERRWGATVSHGPATRLRNPTDKRGNPDDVREEAAENISLDNEEPLV